MDDIDNGIRKRSNSLNQSYCDSIKRISRQENVDLFSLPQELVQKREQAWDRLFNKYKGEVLNDYEINMIDIDMDVNENDENIDDESNDDNDEKEENYFVKNRTPIRKSPALVQYWIDTGNPPYQLTLNNDDSESSLSEEPKSSPLILHKQSETEGKLDNSTSFLSSVDTAAYILSNTNVTTKANALAIVEGAKKSDSLTVTNNSLLNVSKECISTNETSIDRNNQSIKNVKNFKIIDDHSIGINIGNFEPCIKSKLKNNVIETNQSLDHKSCDKPLDKPITQSSVKITDVLPTLEQLDKTLNNNRDIVDDSSGIISVSHDRSSINGKRLSRMKLFTDRNSPVDLTISTANHTSRSRISTNFLHPAFETTPTMKKSRSLVKRSRWFARRRKRSSRMKNLEEISEENDLESVNKTIEHTEEGTNLKSNSTCDANIVDANKLPVNNDNDALDDDKKISNLMTLCQKKNLILRLKKIPDDQLPSKNIDTVDKNNLVCTVTDLSKKISENKEPDFLFTDSQESDESTILICKCNNNKVSSSFLKSHEHSDDESSQIKYIKLNTESMEKQLKQQIQNVDEINKNKNNRSPKSYKSATEQVKQVFDDDEDSSDIFIGKFNKTASSNTLSQIQSIMSRIDLTVVNNQLSTEFNKTNHPEKSDQSSTLGITFSSDEEDDFVKMIFGKTEDDNKSTLFDNNSKEDAIENRNIVNNCNKSKKASKLRLVSSSDDEKVEMIIPKRKTRRRYTYHNEKLTKPVEKILLSDNNFNDKSTKRNKRKTSFKHSEKLNFSTSDSSNKSIAPIKKLKIVPVDTPGSIVDIIDNDNVDIDQSQAVNSINSDKQLIVVSTENSLLKNKNTRSPVKSNPSIRPKNKQNLNCAAGKQLNVFEKENKKKELSSKIIKNCYVSLIKYPMSKSSVDSGLSSLESLSNKINDKQSDVEILCSDNAKSTSTTKKQNKNAQVLLNKKSKRSNIKRSSTRLMKKVIEKHDSTSTSDDSSSENIHIQRRSVRNESKPSHITGKNEVNLLNSIFPDPFNDSDLSESSIFFEKSIDNFE